MFTFVECCVAEWLESHLIQCNVKLCHYDKISLKKLLLSLINFISFASNYVILTLVPVMLSTLWNCTITINAGGDPWKMLHQLSWLWLQTNERIPQDRLRTDCTIVSLLGGSVCVALWLESWPAPLEHLPVAGLFPRLSWVTWGRSAVFVDGLWW